MDQNIDIEQGNLVPTTVRWSPSHKNKSQAEIHKHPDMRIKPTRQAL